jgi:ABC-type transport system substrate-binding protein
MLKGATVKLALVFCLMVFSWALSPMEDAFAQKEGGTLRVALTAEPRPIDTHVHFGDKNCDILCQHVYENLVMVDKQMKIVPVLATSWEIAPDFKSCTFRLRKGVKFHDGTPFNAKAVEANFKRISTTKPKAWKFIEPWFKSTDVLDEYTIRINFNQVYTPFLSEMAQVYSRIISPLAIEKYGEQLGNNPSGTGPWKFSKWDPGEKITLVRFPDYWGGKPRLQEVVFKITPDNTTRMMAFESQSLDLIDQPQYMDIERMEKTGKYKTLTQPSSELFHFAFNTLFKPLDQKEVRHAIKFAVNRQMIVKSQLGENVYIANGFGPFFLPETLKKEDVLQYNPEKAKEILRGLGWRPGPDGILVKEGQRLEFELMTPSGRYPMDKQISEAVQSNLKAIGIDVKLNVVEGAAFINWVMGDAEMKRGTKVGMVALTRPLGATLENAFVQHYHSDFRPKKGFNVSSFANKEFDKLMESARSIANDKERARVYAKAQEILFDELPALPIYYYRSYSFTWPYVKEVELFPPAYTPCPFITNKTWIDK